MDDKKIIEIVINTISRLSRKYNADAQFLDFELFKNKELSINFNSSRFEGFFEAREGEEDDDFPDFVKANEITNEIKNVLGKDYSVSAYDHEKGLFTVIVKKVENI
jgi:hypothetical protein